MSERVDVLDGDHKGVAQTDGDGDVAGSARRSGDVAEPVAADEVAKAAATQGVADVADEEGIEEDSRGSGPKYRPIQPWPEPVDGASLLDEIARFYQQHLILPEGGADAAALWCVFSHALDWFRHNPILAFISPVFGCGKTTAIRITQGFVPRPQVTSNITGPGVFRLIEKHRPTLLFDEADTYLRGDDNGMRGILNSGHDRTGAEVIRCTGKNFEKPQSFSTWTPKVIAKIGKLEDTLESRSVVITMQRKRPDEVVASFTPKDEKRQKELARMIARWVKDHRKELERLEPSIPPSLYNRARDNWRPLLGIAELAGDRWVARAQRAAILLSGSKEDPSREVMLLADCRTVFQNKLHLSTAALCSALNGMETRPWSEMRYGQGINAKGLAKMLKPFGIESGNIREGKTVFKGLKAEDFKDAWARYLPCCGQSPDSAGDGGEGPLPLFDWADGQPALSALPNTTATPATSTEAQRQQELAGARCRYNTCYARATRSYTARCSAGQMKKSPATPRRFSRHAASLNGGRA